MAQLVLWCMAALLAGGAIPERTGREDASTPADAQAPLVIAHRGASAYLPEHTLVAYALAYGMGADMIEPDVVATRDGAMVCSHDVTVPNAAAMRALYPDRAREDGEFYFLDFTLDELRALDQSPGRHGERLPGVGIATLAECLALVDEMNTRTGRNVGVIPEPKRPGWHREHGFDLAMELAATLGDAGYTSRSHAAVIQCFELDELRRVRESGCDLPLVYLTGDPIPDALLDDLATWADGIGPSWRLIESSEDRQAADPDLVERALTRGLGVYPYTFRTDEARQRRFIERGVTGMFTDNPDVLRRLVDAE